jgi:type IV pilus assembly protein PilZ
MELVVSGEGRRRSDPSEAKRDGVDAEPSERPLQDRRAHERVSTWLQVDITSGDTFLFAYITNISEMGIFVRSENPLPVGTVLRLRFSPEHEPPLELPGVVVWINPMRPDGDNPNPGMGVRFLDLEPEQRERLVAMVRAIAYLQDRERTDGERS